MDMENNRNANAAAYHNFCGIKCISWSAIVAGALVAIGLSFLLNLFSTAIGLSIYHINPDGANTLAIGGMLGFAIGIIATMFFAGWVAGYFGRSYCDKKCCGALYGFTTWCLALVLTILLASSFSRFVEGYTNYLSNKVAATVATVHEKVKQNDLNSIDSSQSSLHQETLGDLSKGTFVLFLMFFLGALASTCGGHAAVSCQQKEGCQTKM